MKFQNHSFALRRASSRWLGALSALACALTASTATAAAPHFRARAHEMLNRSLASGGPILTVTKTADTNDGVCDADCSLREAIAAASDGDTIVFASPAFDPVQTITLTLGQLVISKNLIINGTGAERLIISGNEVSRVFSVSSNTVTTLSGLTVADGRNETGQNGDVGRKFGGGILNDGDLTLINVSVRNNSVWGNVSGSIFGGGISSSFRLTLKDCTVRNNYLLDAGHPRYGGGIHNAGWMLITRSTISDNHFSSSPRQYAAGMYNTGTAMITNSTISGNICNGGVQNGGGGIQNDGSLTITNSTITANSGRDGGGIRNFGNLTIANTIIAGNSSAIAPDLKGNATSLGHNLIGNTAAANITGVTTGNILNQDAQLAPLAENGGATKTHALLPNSPALNAGSNALAVDEDNIPLLTDQRGVARAQGSAPEIGAFEVGSAPPGGRPTVENPFFENVTHSSARLYGTVVSENGFPLTRRGIVYSPTSVNANPRLGETGVIAVDDPAVFLGTFNRTVIGLNAATNYSFAAFAVNSIGTGYSAVATFQTNPPPGGGSLVVTTLADEDNGNSDPANGAGTSLREAVAYASALGGDQTITFSPNLFANGRATLTVSPLLNSIQLANLTGTTTIDGPGANLLTIQGNDAVLLFRKEEGSARFNGMTFDNGLGADGGAIYSQGSTLYVNDCVFTNNRATSRGGAIYNGTLGYFSRCTFAGNSAPSFSGGAIANEGTAWVMNCTFTGNSANHGGAIANVFSASIIRAICSTITGNSATGSGGGLFVNNTDRVYGHNTIVSGNNAPSGPNLSATPTTFGLTSSLIDADPAAIFTTGTLADDGGPTPTIALKPGGPAINAGTNSLAVDHTGAPLATDQRAIARPQGSVVDIGAFEARIPAPPTFSVTNLNRVLFDSAFSLASASGASPAGGTFSGAGVSGGNFNPATAGTGVHTITYAVSPDGIVASATFTVTVNLPATITSENSATFTVGTSASFQLSASGYPATYTFTNDDEALPDGLTLSSSGLLSGTPADGTGGVYILSFKVSNGIAPDGIQSFLLAVNEAPVITNGNVATFVVGTSDKFAMSANGFPAPTFGTTSTLPSGVSLSAAGVLSGTPMPGTGGVYSLVIIASNGIGSDATQSFTLTVNEAVAITSENATTFVVGTAGSFPMTATGFPAPTFSTGSALPNGITLSAAGVLSGTPMPGTGGVYDLAIIASNGGGNDAVQNFTLTINQAPSITSANSAAFTVGNFGSFTVETAGFPAPILSEGGVLPAGVNFDAGLLSGAPATGTAGNYPLVFTATNGVGTDAEQNFTLVVNDAVCTSAPNDLVAWFPGEGDASDAQSGFNGSALNGAGFAAGKVNLGFVFNGTTAVVEVPNNPAWDFGANAFTVQTWVSFNAVSGSDVLVAHSEGTGNVDKWIFWLKNGRLEFHLNGSAVSNITSDATFTPDLGRWYHVAVVRDGSAYRFYVDGVQNGGDRFDANSVPTADAPLSLGKAEALNALNGMLDETQIFSRALSGAEIASVYAASIKGLCFDVPQAINAVSRKTHGAAGDHDIPLPLTGEPAVECRGGDHKIVVTFNNIVTAGSASVSAGSVTGTPTFNADQMTIDLTGVPNAQQITVSLSEVKDGFGQTLPSVVVPMNVLLGEVNGNKMVNASDIGQVKASSGSPVGETNFRADLTADGSINASDISMVKAAAGTFIP